MTLRCPEDLNNPIPETDAISLLDIQNEFGGDYSIQIKEYYRNGAYVESNDEGITDNIPIGPAAAGNPISFADFFCTDGEIIRYIRTNTSNPDISLLFGNNLSSASASNYWTKLRPKRLIIKNGIYVYNTNPYKTSQLNNGYAMRVWDTLRGQLIIENYGFIQGAGGRYGGSSIIANETRTDVNAGGQGGNAIYIGPTVYTLFFNRYYNPSTSKHYYGETAPTGYSVVEASNYFGLYTIQASGTVPLYRLYNQINGANLLTYSTEYNDLVRTSTTKSAFEGQTIITGLNYIPGSITEIKLTYFLGPGFVTIPPSDYTATDGKTIVLTNAITAEQGNLGTFYIYNSTPWIGQGIVGYVYSSSAPNRFPIYRSKNSSESDYLFSTSSTEGPAAGYTSEGIAFYGSTSAAANPKPTIYIKNYGQIAAGGGGGGKGGDGGSNGGLGQGYNQVNTLSNKTVPDAAGPGGDGGTFGNPGGNGQNGSTSNGSPGGPAGVAIYGISYVVGGVTGNAVLGSTTQ